MVEEKATKKFLRESNNLHTFIDTSHLVVYEQLMQRRHVLKK